MSEDERVVVRITSSTGGAKETKPERYDQIPVAALAHLARRFGNGNAKYPATNGRDNWRNGYPWSLSYAALQRHANAFWGGEDIDPDNGEPHLAAVAWHALALLTYSEGEEYRRFDDRQDKPTRLEPLDGEPFTPPRVLEVAIKAHARFGHSGPPCAACREHARIAWCVLVADGSDQ